MISLLEFLKSGNKDKFSSLIKKKYSLHITDIVDNSDEKLEGWGSEVLLALSNNIYELIFNTDFIKFCHKLRWFPTWIGVSDDKVIGIILEPISNRTKHFDKLYHMTNEYTYKNFISKEGLLTILTISEVWTKEDYEAFTDDNIYKYTKYKKSKSKYRSISPRIFVFADKKDLLEIKNQIKIDDPIVLEINLKNHPNIKVYKDNANPDKVSAYYLLEDIPIELIKINDKMTKIINE